MNIADMIKEMEAEDQRARGRARDTGLERVK